ncbi:hypothetical protein QF028_004079 [Neobacillus sp. B4I6]
MYFIMYNQMEERIYQDIIYGYTDSKKQANYLLEKCQNC